MGQISDVTGFIEHPVKGASSAFAILFAISFILHIWQSSKYKSWHDTWLLPCGNIIFTACFICREYTAFHPTSDNTYTASQGLFYSAVPIVTSPLYLFLHRLLSAHISVIPIRPKYIMSPAFLFTIVVISLTSQGTSSFFNPDATDGSVSAGLALLKTSLVLQLFLNVAFILIIGSFYHRCLSRGIFKQDEGRRTRILTMTLCISMAWILLRNLFSTVQIFLPSDSPVWTAEAYFWVFDAASMLAYMITLHVMPPASYMQVRGKSHVARVATKTSDNA